LRLISHGPTRANKAVASRVAFLLLDLHVVCQLVDGPKLNIIHVPFIDSRSED